MYVLFIALFFVHFFITEGQPKKVENLPHWDTKNYHFGFLLGFNISDFGIDYDYEDAPLVVGVRNKASAGFHLGTIGVLHLPNYFALHLIPQFIFTERIIEYDIVDTSKAPYQVRTWVKHVESTYLTISLDLTYRSERLNNFAAYMLVGGNWSIDLASQRKVDNNINPPEEQVIPLKRSNWFLEAGVGLDFFLQYFKFAIEYKFAFSIFNVLNRDNTMFSAPLRSLRPKMHLISFRFEG